MYLSVLDGKVLFGMYIYYIHTFDYSIFPGFKIDQDKIICYSEEDKNKVENLLKENQIEYTIETLFFTEDQRNKVKDKKYKSRTEAIQHLQDEIEEPESEIIPKLKREKKELEQRLKQTESALLTVMFGRK